MWTQKTIQLKDRARGFHLITREIEQALPQRLLECAAFQTRYPTFSVETYNKTRKELPIGWLAAIYRRSDAQQCQSCDKSNV